MDEHELDRQLINGFDAMTEKSPFFSFVITYSAHGPYGEDNVIYQENKDAARLRPSAPTATTSTPWPEPWRPTASSGS